jgi:hypothetical protein
MKAAAEATTIAVASLGGGGCAGECCERSVQDKAARSRAVLL